MKDNVNESSIIKNNILGIGINLLKQQAEIDEKLNTSLKVKFEKLEFDKNKYINSMKFNVLLYKVTIRSTELLIGKWIDKESIPNKEELEKDLELISVKCKQYVNKAIKDGISVLTENDIKNFSIYEKLDNNEAISKLELDYKTLSIYNDILNIFLRRLVSNKDSSIDSMPKNPIDAIKEVNKYTRIAVNKVVLKPKEIEPTVEEPVSKKEESSYEMSRLELDYLNKLENLSYEQLCNKMDKVYRVLCSLEKVKYFKGYGFGEESIKEYAGAVILLDLINEENRNLIDGGVRLVISGMFGAINFSDYMDHIVVHKIGIHINVWNNINDIIGNKYEEIINNELAKKEIKDSVYVDIEEYIYMIQNADKYESFGKVDLEEEVKEDDENIDEEYVHKSNKGLKRLVGLGVILGICLGMIILINTNENDEDLPSVVKSYDETKVDDGYTKEFEDMYFKSDSFIIEDSNDRYLTKDELKSYTKSELGLIRNEIFARHGYVFHDEPYKTYFNSKSWYIPNENIKGDVEELNDVEINNLDLIKELEGTKSSTNDNNSESKEKESKPKEPIKPISYEYVDYDYDQVYYSVYTTAYTNESMAKKQVKDLLAKGIKSTIVYEDDYYKVRVGSDYDFDSAKVISDKIRNLSFDTYILAYDKYVEAELDELTDLGFNGYYDEFNMECENLMYELSSRLGYERYVKQLENMYSGVTEGA